MLDFLVLGTLPWRVLTLFIIQMMIITAVVRGVMACQQRLLWGNWHIRSDVVILGHAVALFGFAAMSDFVGSGAPASDGIAALLHSLAVLWPLQVILLAADLLARKMRTRRRAVS